MGNGLNEARSGDGGMMTKVSATPGVILVSSAKPLEAYDGTRMHASAALSFK